MRGMRPRLHDILAAGGFEWTLYWRRRRLRFATLVAALPLLIAIFIALLKVGPVPGMDPVLRRGVDIVPWIFSLVYFVVLVFLVPMVLGIGVVSKEVEGRTLQFLLVRPISRGSLLLGKYLGAAAISSVLLSASFASFCLVLALADRFAGIGELLPHLPAYVLSLCVGAFAYASVFTLLGLIARHAVLVGFGVFLLDSAVAFLPGLIRSVSVRYHLLSLVPESGIPPVLRLLNAPPAGEAFVSLCVGTALFLLAAVAVFARRNYA